MPRAAANKLMQKIHAHGNAKWGNTISKEKDLSNIQRTG